MILPFGIALAIIMPLEWVAAGKRWNRIRVISKPLSLLLLIALFSSLGGWVSQGFWFGLGLVFSLLGDIFLLCRTRFFIFGLFSFLLAHIFYILGFLYGPLQLTWLVILPFLVVLGFCSVAYPKLIGGVRRRMEHKRLWLPVLLYMITITVMVSSAFLTWFRPQWSIIAALAASLGAFLFTISDTVLATGRFLRPVPYGNFLVMFTYHLGQLGITLGALWMLGAI